MNKIGVMVIEDSPTVREMICQIVEGDSRLKVVASVDSAEAGLRVLNEVAPDVISLDIRLPGMNGFEATLKIMSERPTPIVVISNNVEGEELKISLNALRAGALSVVEKPAGFNHPEFSGFASRIREQLVTMSSVKVVRQRFAREWPLTTRKEVKQDDEVLAPRIRNMIQLDRNLGRFTMLGVVASTGGPAALIRLFQALPADFPIPIALVQHITGSFVASFASWLSGSCPFEARIAADGEMAKPGTIYLAPPDSHLTVEANRLRLIQTDWVCSERPSGSVLFESMAKSLGENSLGVILTGMGADGADGLLKIKQAGGHTIAEDYTTAVIYGMPGVAVRIGAVCESLPIDTIGARVVELVSGRKEQG